MDNIEQCAEKIVDNLDKEIVIVADIDCDGVTAAAFMKNYLSNFNNGVKIIHAQRSDGHGVDYVLDQISKDIDLLIIVDSSSNDSETCRMIKEEFDVEIVIIDHHEIEKKNNFATVVNCMQGDYPNRFLSGSAMVWKVCTVLDDKLNTKLADDYIDLAGVGLIGDMMNLSVPENRYIVYKAINNIKNSGLSYIIQKKKINKIDSMAIGFNIAPLINASARLDKLELGIKMLTTSDGQELEECFDELMYMNVERMNTEKTMTEKAKNQMVDAGSFVYVIENLQDEKIDLKLTSGYRGLIANKLAQQTQKPVFVLKGGIYDKVKTYAGSARSYNNIPFLNACLDTGLFNFANGHSSAFGVGFNQDKLDDVVNALNEKLKELVQESLYEYDLDVKREDCDMHLAKELEKFNTISGTGFPSAKIMVKNLNVDSIDVLGKNNDTIKITSNQMSLMLFKVNPNDVDIGVFDEIDVVGLIGVNEWQKWNGEVIRTLQIIIDDYKVLE